MLNLQRSNGCGDLLGENTRERKKKERGQLIYFFFPFSFLLPSERE